MKNLSITSRMLLIALLPALTVAAILGVYFSASELSDIRETEMNYVYSTANSMALASEFAIGTGNEQLLRAVTRSADPVGSITHVRFYDKDQQLLLSQNISGNEPANIGRLPRLLQPILFGDSLYSSIIVNVERTDLSKFEDPLFIALNPQLSENNANTRNEGNIIGQLHIDLNFNRVYLNQLEWLVRAMMIVLLVLLPVMMAAYTLAQSVSSPIRKLTHAVGLLSRNDYSADTEVNTGGELNELAQGVSTLSRELESFHSRIGEEIDIATRDLKHTLEILEERNLQLDETRRAAEKANAFKSEFLANISHEIRTPMNNIVGTLSLMNRTPANDYQANQLQRIDQSSKTLLALIDDVLDLSKIESGNLDLEYQRVDLEQLLDSIYQHFVQLASKKRIELFFEQDLSESYNLVRTDPLRLKQILLNLVGNAIKFTDHGHVLLSVSIEGANNNPPTYRFSIKDTGVGFPESKINDIFSAFKQLDMTTRRNYGGSGLGLHICKELTSLMGGKIDAKSTPGEGSEFIVKLPFVYVDVVGTHNLASAGNDYADQLPPMVLHCAYPPLVTQVKRLLLRAGLENLSEMVSTSDKTSPLVVYLTHALIENNIEQCLPPACMEFTHRYAMLNDIRPHTRQQLLKQGFSGLILCSPSTWHLNESIHKALIGKSLDPSQGCASADPFTPELARTIRVLAVDDQSLNLQLLEEFFNLLDVQYETASNYQEAIDLVNKQVFDIVLLDLHIPGRDGFEILSQIRSTENPNRLVPVVALTADAFVSTKTRAFECGFDSLITKPVEFEQIRDVLDVPVRHTPYVSPTGSEQALVSINRAAELVRGEMQWAANALRTYALDIPSNKKALVDSVVSHDCDKLFQAAHQMKGISEICQIDAVVNYLKEIETQSQNNDWPALRRTVDALVYLLDEVEIKCIEEADSQIQAEVPVELG